MCISSRHGAASRSCSYPSRAGLFGWKVHIGHHSNRLHCGDRQGVAVGGRRGNGGGEAADLADPLLHAAGGQPSLGVVVPTLLHRLADQSQTLNSNHEQALTTAGHTYCNEDRRVRNSRCV